MSEQVATAGQRRALIAGNWKLHMSVTESVALARALRDQVSPHAAASVAVAPVFTALSAVAEALSGSAIAVAAQNLYWEPQGAFTGEVSAPLLKDVGCSMAIIGHSERRQLFGETDEAVNRKVAAALAMDLTPILCVGETLEERESQRTLPVVLGQLSAGLDGLEPALARRVVVAYEPVWAIGTGRTASPGDAQEVHAAIRGRLAETFSADVAAVMPILYGGSVKPDNARDLMAQPDIDGALVGGASLSAESFVAIIDAVDS